MGLTFIGSLLQTCRRRSGLTCRLSLIILSMLSMSHQKGIKNEELRNYQKWQVGVDRFGHLRCDSHLCPGIEARKRKTIRPENILKILGGMCPTFRSIACLNVTCLFARQR